jgi:hypothetical protein
MASGGKAGRRQPWLETALWELHWRGVFGHDWSRPRLWERTKAGRTPWLLKEPHLKNPIPNRVGEALLHTGRIGALAEIRFAWGSTDQLGSEPTNAAPSRGPLRFAIAHR